MSDELARRGWRVVRVDREPMSDWLPDKFVHAIEPTRMDVREFFASDGTAEPGWYDLVVHCAAVVGGRAMIEGKPLELACEDLSIDAAMFQWAMKAQPGRIVYYSSSAAYPIAMQSEVPGQFVYTLRPGEERSQRLPESAIDPHKPAMPDQTYGWVKLTGERLAREYQAADGKVTVLRPFSGYGEDQDLSYPFPAIMERVARGDDPIDVWGPGTQVRDWIHIDDVIAGTLAAVEAEVDEPMNLCTGRATTFVDLVQRAQLVAMDHHVDARKRPIRPHPDQPTGVMYRCGDPTRMLKVYEPKVTLEEGIRRALA
jgi:nucleoside-diphosphate-sugar epimerase